MTPAQAKKRYTRIKEWDYQNPRLYSVYLTVSDGEVLQEFDVLSTTFQTSAKRVQNMLARALCRIVKQQTRKEKS